MRDGVKPAAAKKMGRPTTAEPVRDRVLELLEEGYSLTQASAVAKVGRSSVLRWIDSDEDFRSKYARARDIGYAKLADEIIEDARTGTGDVNRDRLIVDTKKWYLSKVLPKTFGDRTAVDLHIDVSDDLIKAMHERRRGA